MRSAVNTQAASIMLVLCLVPELTAFWWFRLFWL